METAYFTKQVARFIARHKMMSDGERVLVALSGGADSVALLSVLKQLGYECVAAHCNFHLRGEESMRDEHFVRDLCNRIGVTLVVRDFDVPTRMAADHSSLEMACRDLRYEWFENVRAENRCRRIAVAHHRDDNVETLMLNLLRGTGIAGVAGIKPVNECIVRPLLCVSRREIEGYLAANGQDYITDSTNALNDAKRNKLRNIVLPTLRECFPNADAGLSRSLENMLSCNELYDSLLSHKLSQVVRQERDHTAIDIKTIASQPGAEAMLFGAMQPLGFNSAQVAELLDTYLRHEPSTGKTFLAKMHKATIDRNRIIVTPTTAEPQRIIPIDLDSRGIDEPIKIEISRIAAADFDPSWCDGRNRVCFGEDIKHCKTIVIRRWQKGDRFKPFGMHGRSRLVSDLFTDLKLSDAQKRQAWLLVADDEILWVIGYRSGETYRVATDSQCGHVYRFSAR